MEPEQPEVRIESPFPRYAIRRIWDWTRDFPLSVADDYGPQTLAQFCEAYDREAAAGRRSWVVWRDGEMGGFLCSTRMSPVLADLHFVFKKSFWGRKTTEPAIRHVIEELFADGVLKMTSMCYVNNRPVIGIVKYLGATREGVLEKHTMRGGELTDVAVMGLRKEQYHGGTVRVQRIEAEVEFGVRGPGEGTRIEPWHELRHEHGNDHGNEHWNDGGNGHERGAIDHREGSDGRPEADPAEPRADDHAVLAAAAGRGGADAGAGAGASQ